MTANSIQITQGSGTRLATNSYTEGGNTVHDEKQILGEQYLASYVIDQSSVSVATANDHIMQIMAGSSLNVYVRRIRVWQAVAATTAALATIQIFRLSTAGTGGTTNSVDPLDTTDAAAGATAQSLPTVKGTETTRLYTVTVGYMQTISTAGYNPLLLDLNFDQLRIKPIRIPSGTTNGIAVKHVTATAGASVLVVAEVVEASF